MGPIMMIAPQKVDSDLDMSGWRILVVEDHYLLADEIRRALRRHGAEVIGPAANLAAGLALARHEPIDGAVLDINLDGEQVFGIADELSRRGIPFVFATGYEGWSLPAAYQSMKRIEKPFDIAELIGALFGIVRKQASEQSKR